MKDIDYDLFIDNEEDSDKETIEELKKANKSRNKSFATILNKKKLSKLELDEVMA
ncbi:hypothetical protein HYU11_00810 [Candidatus Woesearchaeota archaeon]|nr:hypothetical protein [Candidatus Woesearchaeota archaeon]